VAVNVRTVSDVHPTRRKGRHQSTAVICPFGRHFSYWSAASQLTRSIQLMAIVGRDQADRNEGNGKAQPEKIRAKMAKNRCGCQVDFFRVCLTNPLVSQFHPHAVSFRRCAVYSAASFCCRCLAVTCAFYHLCVRARFVSDSVAASTFVATSSRASSFSKIHTATRERKLPIRPPEYKETESVAV
jgi:hypothetical protein